MKRVALAAAAALAGAMSLGTAVGAEPPERVSFPAVFEGANPCSGETHVVSVTREILIAGGDRFVAPGSNTGSTSDGYELVNGTFRFVEQADGIDWRINDVWRHPDGSRFVVHAAFTILPDGSIREDSFDARCLGS